MQVEGGGGLLLDEAERLEGEPGGLLHPVDGDYGLAVPVAPGAGEPMLFHLTFLVVYVMENIEKYIDGWMDGCTAQGVVKNVFLQELQNAINYILVPNVSAETEPRHCPSVCGLAMPCNTLLCYFYRRRQGTHPTKRSCVMLLREKKAVEA